MKKVVAPAVFTICVLAYGLIISQFRPPILVTELEPPNAAGYYDYKGVTNSHTSVNKGSLSPEEVIAEAQKSGLDFIFLTDLNHFDEYPVEANYYGNLLVSIANVYSYLDSHIIHYSLNPPEFSGLGEVQVFLSDRLYKENSKEEDFLVLAHPFKGGENWEGEYPPALAGIETLNLKSVWRKAWSTTRFSFFWSVFIYPFNSHLSLLRLFQHPEKEVQLWDKLNTNRPTTGFVGNETTSKIIPVGKNLFRFPSYQTSFEIASNHVLLRSELTGDFAKDRIKIFNALKRGQFYMSLDYLENPKGFVTFVKSKTNEYPLGSHIEFQQDLNLHVRLPQKPIVPFEVIVYRGETPIFRSHEKETVLPIEKKGAYRIVVRVIPTLPLPDGKKWIPWIYSNPFFID